MPLAGPQSSDGSSATRYYSRSDGNTLGNLKAPGPVAIRTLIVCCQSFSLHIEGLGVLRIYYNVLTPFRSPV